MDKYVKRENVVAHIRVTAAERSTIDEARVDALFNATFAKYIIGYELNHFHVMLVTKTKDNWLEGSKQKKLRDWLKENIIPLVEHQIGKQHSYSISIARTVKQLCKYVVKDGHYTYKGFTLQEVKGFEMASFKKGKRTYNQAKSDITEAFMEDKIGDAEFFEKMLRLNSEYGYSSYINHMRAYHITKKSKKDPQWRKQYAEYQVSQFLRLDN